MDSLYFQNWGIMTTPSHITHKFTPFVYAANGSYKLCHSSAEYAYTFEMKEVSFSQGNIGTLKYLNSWERVPLKTYIHPQIQGNFNVINLEADQVYSYDYFTPDSRQFSLLYNVIFDMISKQFIPDFYSYYIFEFFFKNLSMVQKRIFNPLGLSEERGI